MILAVLKVLIVIYGGYYLLNCYTRGEISKCIMKEDNYYQTSLASLIQETTFKISEIAGKLISLLDCNNESNSSNTQNMRYPKSWKVVKMKVPQKKVSHQKINTLEEKMSIFSYLCCVADKIWNGLLHLLVTIRKLISLDPCFSFVCGGLLGLLIPRIIIRSSNNQYEDFDDISRESTEGRIHAIIQKTISSLEDKIEKLEHQTAMWMNSIEERITPLQESDHLTQVDNTRAGIPQETGRLLQKMMESRKKQGEDIISDRKQHNKMLQELKSEIDLIKDDMEDQKRNMTVKIEKMIEQNENADISKNNFDITGNIEKHQKLIESVKNDCNNQYLTLSTELSNYQLQTKQQLKMLNNKHFMLQRKMSETFGEFTKRLAEIENFSNYVRSTSKGTRKQVVERIIEQDERTNMSRIISPTTKISAFPSTQDVSQWLQSTCPFKSGSHHSSTQQRERRMCSIISRSPLAYKVANSLPDMIKLNQKYRL